jgi:serine/threonine-protein kinase
MGSDDPGDLPETRIGAPKPSRRFSAAPEVDPCPPGTLVGEKYEVTSRIGRGGMGVVVAAKHIELGHSVAIKMMHEEDAQHAISVRRFLREGRAAAALKSDYAVRIYDVGRLPSGVPYLVMEHLEGSDLSAYVKRKRQLPVAEAVEYIVQASYALSEAHASGLIHRDLKPHNLFLARLSDGRKRIKVLDFGLVKEATSSELTSTAQTPSAPEGTILGSPHFMSPEQIRDPGGVDLRTDIWSLGATFFQLLTGEPPFHALTIHLLLAKILSDPAPDVRTLRSDVPEGVARVIAKCLAREPKDRYSNVENLVRALNACGATTAIPTTRIVTPTGGLTPLSAPSPVALGTTRGQSLAAPLPVPHPEGRSPTGPPPPIEQTKGFGPHLDSTKQGLGSVNAQIAPITLAPKTLAMPVATRAPTSASIDAVEPPPADPAQPRSLRGSHVVLAFVFAAIIGGVGYVALHRMAKHPTAASTPSSSTAVPSASDLALAPAPSSASASGPASASAPASALAHASEPASGSSPPASSSAASISVTTKPKPRPAARPSSGAPRSSSPDPYGWQP